MMILFVFFQMFGKILNPMGQKPYLNLRRSSIVLVQLKSIDKFFFLLCR